MDAVILDVGGVLLVPHAEAVNPALEPFGIQLSLEQAERAHYGGVRALDAADEATDLDGSAYLNGYVRGWRGGRRPRAGAGSPAGGVR